MTSRTTATRILAALFLAILTLSGRGSRAADAVWIEGEAPASINVKPNVSGWGHPEYLSGEKWLQVSIDADKVDNELPEGGAIIRYVFATSQEARYEVWNRIGYEFARSPFDWRLDGGEWLRIGPQELTTDQMELQTWNEVAWLKMGSAPLSAGEHTIDIRLPKTVDTKGKTAGILYASDALCLSPMPFYPNGPFKPGAAWQSDRDRAAGQHVFSLTAAPTATQTPLALTGDWQVARYDEGLVEDRTGLIHELPAPDTLFWKAIPIPGNRDQSHPELILNHRYLLRTHIDVPQSWSGHAFYLHFPSINMIATVFVNGVRCGWTKAPFAAWDCDVTRALKPGTVNEITVGIKDTYYALASSDGKNVRYGFNIPPEAFSEYQGITFQLDFPVWNHRQNGILIAPTLVAAGEAYTSDVFAIPSVTAHTLGVEVTVHNASEHPITVSVENSVEPLEGGPPVKRFAPHPLEVAAGQESLLKISETWSNPHLWWPDDPRQYRVVTRLTSNGKALDQRATKFGFREWGWKGSHFTLNGMPWYGRADLTDYETKDPEAALRTWRKHGQNMERLWSEDGWGGMDREQALDFFDSHGVPIRRTGIFDGETAKYGLTEQVTENGKEVTRARKALYDNWREQLVAWAKGQRNHPSIFVWSMENEITFINAAVFGLNSYSDPEMRTAAEQLAALDPTRPQMVDGGNALLDQSLPIYGGHYLESAYTEYPGEAYTQRKMHDPGHQRWPMTGEKPIFLGESFFASGGAPPSYASIGGESAFVGKAETGKPIGLIARMLSEGYRWSGLAAFQFWFAGESDAHYIAWQPLAVLCRQWDWHFASGETVRRTLGIFNDTRSAERVALTWTLSVGGRTVASSTKEYRIAPGENTKFDVSLKMPAVTARQDGAWALALTRGGKRLFQDTKQFSLFAPARTAPAGGPALAAYRVAAHSLLVYDPAGQTVAYLRAAGRQYESIRSLGALPESGRMLIVGKDALTPAESASSRLAAYAAAGRAVLILEQKNPLRYQGLPAAMEAATNEGRIAFSEDLDHPAFHGIHQADFAFWGSTNVVYRNAYRKPTRGGRSLVECDNELEDTALAEVPAGKGLLLLSQLILADQLATNPVAQHLLANLIQYGAAYRQTFRPVTYVAAPGAQLNHAVEAMGLNYAGASGALQAIARPGGIALMTATPENLKELAANPARVNAFLHAGGWIMLNALTPDGLQDYNGLVGFDHMIRPFWRERVTFPPIRNPLTAGLATGNIVMGSGQRIFGFRDDEYTSTDAFSYVVDYDDVAPFARFPNDFDRNMVNGFVSADGWPLIVDLELPKTGLLDVSFELPKPQTITEFTWIGNVMYFPTARVNLIFDGNRPNMASTATNPNDAPQSFPVSPPRTGKRITLEWAEWERIANTRQFVGVDNIALKAARPPDFYKKVKPMLNIGAMMEYPRGRGGIILCNVNFLERETVPINATKKITILSTILRNLNAPFSGGKSIIAGTHLQYRPIDISRQANQYRDEKGWFGDGKFTFKDLPTGRQVFAGVPYHIYDFPTSPVPTAIMLAGPGVPNKLSDAVKGIPVHRKADALFFLQAARIDTRRTPQDVRENKQYELARYVVHYSGGTTAVIPVAAEVNVDDYRQKAPAALPGAQIAWTRPYEGTGLTAVAYAQQWNNPKPQLVIESIDMEYGDAGRGVPVLLAITAAVAAAQ